MGPFTKRHNYRQSKDQAIIVSTNTAKKVIIIEKKIKKMFEENGLSLNFCKMSSKVGTLVKTRTYITQRWSSSDTLVEIDIFVEGSNATWVMKYNTHNKSKIREVLRTFSSMLNKGLISFE